MSDVAPARPDAPEDDAVFDDPVRAPSEPASADTDRPPAFLLARDEAVPSSDAPPPPDDLAQVIESLLLVAEEPPTVRHLAQATNVPPDAVEEALEVINARAGRGIRIRRHGESVALVSAPESAPYVEQFLGLERPNRLSKAALETLAIIAYQQPVTRATIERIRGVSADGALRTLRARELIEPVGELDGPGHPHLWAVTGRFLEHFGMSAISELPPLPELPEPAEQGRFAMDREPVPEQDDVASGDDADAPERLERAPLAFPDPSPAVAGGGGGA